MIEIIAQVVGSGPRGETGPQGEQGIQGEQGLKGDKGDQGLQGIQGPQGIKGDKGEQGIQGVKGDTGEQGIQGIKGDKGDTGEQGIQGIQGEQGIQGIKGDDGYTPIKGVDYFTDTEITEILSPTNEKISKIANKKSSDFLHIQDIGGIPIRNIASGTINTITPETGHPGIVVYTSSTNANSGSGLATSGTFFLSGGEEASLVFKTPATMITITRRFGFLSTVDSNNPTNGCYGEIVDGVLVGKTSSNSIRSTTASSYVLSSGTWYIFKVQIESDFSLVKFKLYSENGVIVWEDTLSTNLPIDKSNGFGDLAYSSGTSQITVGYLDYYEFILSGKRDVI